jgi:hypothetical protein
MWGNTDKVDPASGAVSTSRHAVVLVCVSVAALMRLSRA